MRLSSRGTEPKQRLGQDTVPQAGAMLTDARRRATRSPEGAAFTQAARSRFTQTSRSRLSRQNRPTRPKRDRDMTQECAFAREQPTDDTFGLRRRRMQLLDVFAGGAKTVEQRHRERGRRNSA